MSSLVALVVLAVLAGAVLVFWVCIMRADHRPPRPPRRRKPRRRWRWGKS